ncbi:hypothetical protein FRC06_006090 [Ceratobasidium sp. 370]|nr:hypothetical protein FRC06_006090 [Ceratobasidium sp. 370]
MSRSASEVSPGIGSGSAVPNRLFGSTATDRVKTVTAASRVARSTPLFLTWAKDVLLVPPQDEQPSSLPLPDALKQLQDGSRLVPDWIFNPVGMLTVRNRNVRLTLEQNALQYQCTRSRFQDHVDFLGSPSARASFTTTTIDQELSEDVASSLPSIFEVLQHEFYLTEHEASRPNEADRRLAVDHLTSHLWDYSPGGDFIHRVECAVQLPNCAKTTVEESRPDSTVFFRLESTILKSANERIMHACSSIPARQHPVPPWRYVLHWVTEFKGDGQPIESKRQTWMAMVTGLYQRRSLGFKDQYVFGTAHHSSVLLDVFAGQWVADADLPEAARSDPATEKIMIYPLGTFRMHSVTAMLQYYLLMRSTRHLALNNKALINDKARILVSEVENANNHSWPPAAQPLPSAGAKKRKASGPGSQTNPAGNVPETNTACLDTGDYVQQPVHIVGVDDPLMHRFAEALSEDGESAKVQGYLASSIHDHYDYQVGR